MKYMISHIKKYPNENLFTVNTMSKWDDFITFDEKREYSILTTCIIIKKKIIVSIN